MFQFYDEDTEAIAVLNSVDWDSWYHKPGLPPKPEFHSSEYDKCIRLATHWRDLEAATAFTPHAEDMKGWTAGQSISFLDHLIDAPRPMSHKSFQMLGSLYGLKKAKNFEILSRYLRVGLRSKDMEVLPDTEEFLGQTGRMKFVRPM